jgi:hypothetical protein
VDTQAVLQVLPLGEVVPAGHETHALALLALVTPEYVPARQFVHTALPVAILYVPATQAVHGPPFGPVKPTLHVQAARAALEIGEYELAGHARHVAEAEAPVAVEYVPAAQSVQTALPVAILYLPATQDEQTPPFGPVKPTLHVQAARTVLEIGEYELAGHARQVAADEAPVAVEYVPAEHPVHALADTAVEYDPGAQFVQPPPET